MAEKTEPAPQDVNARLIAKTIPVTVLTGFLGAGKTTLLNKLLSHPDMGEAAVLINEFGEIGLDHLLVKETREDTVLLNSGCLCCTVRGDLVNAMRELFWQRFDKKIPWFKRMVIETTGLADPAPIIHTLMTDPTVGPRYRLDGIVTVVDAVNGPATLDAQPEAVKQAAVADRISYGASTCEAGAEAGISSPGPLGRAPIEVAPPGSAVEAASAMLQLRLTQSL